MVYPIAVGEDVTLSNATGGSSSAEVKDGGIAGNHEESSVPSANEAWASAGTLLQSTTISLAQVWTEVDIKGDSSRDARIIMSGSYRGGINATVGTGKVTIDTTVINATYGDNDPEETSAVLDESKSYLGGEKYEGSFEEVMNKRLYPDSNYYIGVRLRAAASSTGPAFAQSDFNEVLDGENLQGDAYAGYDNIDITWA